MSGFEDVDIEQAGDAIVDWINGKRRAPMLRVNLGNERAAFRICEHCGSDPCRCLDDAA